MCRPANGVADVKAGIAAIDQLRRAAEAANIIVDTEQAAIDERKARGARQQKQAEDRRALLGDLSDRFADLAKEKPRMPAELQARGYELEKLLVDLFKANDIDYLGSRRTPHEQVDGSFFFHGFTYLVEARWRQDKPTTGDLADFKFKVDGKIDSTRGLFISIAGFDDEVLEHFANNSGTRRNVMYMTGHDLALIFGGHVGLVDALLVKINAAESRGKLPHRPHAAVTMRLVIGLLGAGLMVVGCSDSSGYAAPAPVTESAPAVTSTSPPAPRLVSAAAAGDALLKRTELGQTIGDTDLRQDKTYTKPSESDEGVQPRDCAPRLLFSEAVAATGYQTAVGDSNRGARGQSAAQLITVFVDREPARVVGDLGRMLGYCAEGESFSTTAGDVTQQWIAGPAASDALGPVSDATRAGGGAQRQEAPPRNCHHAAAMRANVVVESVVCGDGDSTGQASEIVDRITAKLPQ